MNEEFFAVDIGTRKVMGLVCRPFEGRLKILDVEVLEHKSRPMFDGQVHCIDDVVATIRKIHDAVSLRRNRKFENVGVAVAGRNLLTLRGQIKKDFGVITEISQQCLREIELETIVKIAEESQKDLSNFYCVGYSPLLYEVDGVGLRDVTGHKGRFIKVEVIATFLPRVVLDSILAVLEKASLKATNVTLEPIAALEAIIPFEMRNLNIMLVDIGAGTSDVAIVKDGTVVSYGMVPEAGDEITEKIARHLLCDFQTAEYIKRSVEKVQVIDYEDIWGRSQSISAMEVKKLIQPAVKHLAESIAQVGLELNGVQPEAVVLVGGGSLTPDIALHLGRTLKLSEDKIGIRLPKMIRNIIDNTGKLSGPEAVTPIGIAQMTQKAQGIKFIQVYVNGQKQLLMDFSQKKDVLGVLTLSGIINKKHLCPRPGMALTVTVNGQLKVIRGGLGQPAQIMVNGKMIDKLSDALQDGDNIEVIEAKDGCDASATIQDLVPPKPIEVIYNGENIQLLPKVFLGNKRVSYSTQVPDRAQIKVEPLNLRDVLESQGIDVGRLIKRKMVITIDGNPKELPVTNFTLLVNNKIADLGQEINDGDKINFNFKDLTEYRVGDVIDFPQTKDILHISVNGEDIALTMERIQVYVNGVRAMADTVITDKAEVRTYFVREQNVLLSEIFKYIQIDPQKILGKRIRIFVDDMPAGFTTPLSNGSRVKFLLEDRN